MEALRGARHRSIVEISDGSADQLRIIWRSTYGETTIEWSAARKDRIAQVSRPMSGTAIALSAIASPPFGLVVDTFKPEHAGKMNFYLSAVGDRLKHKDDQPSIGLLLCRSKNRVQVEYALRDIQKPIGVAEWETLCAPKPMKHLPVLQVQHGLGHGLGLAGLRGTDRRWPPNNR